MNEKVLNLLDSYDWKNTIIQLAAYSVNLCRIKNIQLPKGLEPEDLTMDAIQKVYLGERKWNPDTDPDLFKYLKSVVKSILDNEIKSKDGQVVKIEEQSEEYIIRVENYIEEEIYCKQLDQQISFNMRGDPELCLVYKAIKDGLKPGDIAKEYAIPINLVRNTLKRLLRLVHKMISKLQKS